MQRQVVGVARHKERLLAAGQHLKRGLLLYGPPGVGKTHTVRYLIGQPDRARPSSQLTGGALHLIAEACSVARALQPAMVVVEDVDLIAEDRGMHPGQHPLLFQLLNEMDGLAEDADVRLRADHQPGRPAGAGAGRPARAGRPGGGARAAGHRRPGGALFELYRGALRGRHQRPRRRSSTRTEGVTASFLKELLRRAAVLAAADADDADDGPLAVSAADLDAALDELLDTRNAMTRVLLGGADTAG